MPGDVLAVPSRTIIVTHVLSGLNRYWVGQQHKLRSLPINVAVCPKITGPLSLKSIVLPGWASLCSVDGCLLVPIEACPVEDDWQRVDWWLAAFLLLECWHERVFEKQHGSIHSYSFKLKGWDERVWGYAWVNRIALFLRLWAAIESRMSSEELFGQFPQAEINITHDVDAVAKTLPIRIKQGAFNILNAMRHVTSGHWTEAKQKIKQAIRFIFSCEDWWVFDDLLMLEERAGIRSCFHFHSDVRPKTLQRWFFDPDYEIGSERVRKLIIRLVEGGWNVGLHQTYDAWQSPSLMREQQQLLQSITPADIISCRQHWLRFGWQCTWEAQALAGFKRDTTLMFNDRAGFRAAAALNWNPYNPDTGREHDLIVLPTILMDSHVYDYKLMTNQERNSAFRRFLNELQVVGGQAAVLWHPHTLTSDYGWRDGFLDLITIAKEMGICVRH